MTFSGELKIQNRLFYVKIGEKLVVSYISQNPLWINITLFINKTIGFFLRTILEQIDQTVRQTFINNLLPRRKWEEVIPGCIFRVSSRKLVSFFNYSRTTENQNKKLGGGWGIVWDSRFLIRRVSCRAREELVSKFSIG